MGIVRWIRKKFKFTEVVRNMPNGFQRVPVELQQVVTKESGMKHRCIHVYDF